MLAPGTARPGAVGDPTTQHRVLRGVLQPGDKPPARALAQITSAKAGYHLGLAMLCLTRWIQRRWPPTRTVPWIWAIPTAHRQVEAGPNMGPNPPPRPQQSLTCGYHAIHRVLSSVGPSPKLAYPLPTTDQEVHQIRKLVCEILAAAAEDGKLLLQTAPPYNWPRKRATASGHIHRHNTPRRTIPAHAPPLLLLTQRPTHAHHRAQPRAPRHGPPPPARTSAHARHTPTRRRPLTTPHTRKPAHTRREEPRAPRHARPTQ